MADNNFKRWEQRQAFRQDAVVLDGVPMSWEHFKSCAYNIEHNGFKALRRKGRDGQGREIYQTYIERMPDDRDWKT